MNTTTRHLKSTAAALLVLAAGLGAAGAHAEALGPYVGGSLGTPHYSDDVNGIGGDGSGVSGKLFGGYQFTPNFSLEAGGADLGHIDERSGKVDAHGVYLDAVGAAPLNDHWALLGRIGVAHMDFDTSAGDDSGSGLKLGAGVQYAISSNLALRGEWERYHTAAFGDRPNVDQYTVGLRFGF